MPGRPAAAIRLARLWALSPSRNLARSAAMPEQSNPRSRRLLLGSIMVGGLAVLLAMMVGLATNVVALLVDEQWVRLHRTAVIGGFLVLAAASLLVAALQV